MKRGKQPLRGESCMRVDAIAKVTGRARYTDDYVMAGTRVMRNMYVALSHMVMP